MSEQNHKMISFASFSPFGVNEWVYDQRLGDDLQIDVHNIITCFKFQKKELEKVLDLVSIDSIIKQMSYGLLQKGYDSVYVGLLPDEDAINLISDYIESRCFNASVVVRADFFDHDNVMIFDPEYVATFSRRLLLIADLLICDSKNLALLTGMDVETIENWASAGDVLKTTGAKNICIFNTQMQTILLSSEDGEVHNFFVPEMQNYTNIEFYNVISELGMYIAAGEFYPAALKKVMKKLNRLYLMADS